MLSGSPINVAANSDPTATITATLIGDPDNITYLTVFAPTNATFESANITADSFDAATWDAIIRNHVVIGQGTATNDLVQPSDLTTCATFTTAAGGTLTIFNDTNTVPADNGLGIFIDSDGDVDCTLADMGASLTNLDAEVAVADAAAGINGTIHVIAGILTP